VWWIAGSASGDAWSSRAGRHARNRACRRHIDTSAANAKGPSMRAQSRRAHTRGAPVAIVFDPWRLAPPLGAAHGQFGNAWAARAATATGVVEHAACAAH
jgi:hypothetical protein